MKKIDLGIAVLSLPVALFVGQLLVTLYLMFFAADEDLAWAFEHSWRGVLVAAIALYFPVYVFLRRRPPGWIRRQVIQQLAFGLAVCVLLGVFFALNFMASSGT
ncbi:hypothetical protein [Pseudoxanthomonas sp. PXM02]|uniref:hypothetical protein n=1 Tax=Pseudoxanthomonas sp. PXM02 TaxID=2769294 RepID=UPI001785F2C9|nr:hypothetical protein [Pseudoxanthomonas sp. PXM02]MBD9481160.1 hypothetical protein [Pseudoxanthomonas sp. PXM02]